jgi:hypothetical protein
MLTFGAAPNAPEAVTAVLDPVEDELEAEDEADDDLEELQPARTAQAVRGTTMSARKRRMKTSMWWMSASLAYWPHRAAVPGIEPTLS